MMLRSTPMFLEPDTEVLDSKLGTFHTVHRSKEAQQSSGLFGHLNVLPSRVRGPTSGRPRGSEATGKGVMRMIIDIA